MDGSGNLAQNNNLVFAGGIFSVGNGSNEAGYLNYGGTTAFHGTDTTTTVDLCNGSVAGTFTDGVRTVTICDGANNVLYVPGTPANWSGAAPTDVWIAIDRLLAWLLTQVGIVGNP